MALTCPDERVVYLSCRSIFKQADAQLRKPKKIREMIQKRESMIRPLLQEHSLDAICGVVKTLLDGQIFESTLHAKIRFPELFEVSEAQSVEREASEAEAVRSEACAAREVAEADEDVSGPLQEGVEIGPMVNNICPELIGAYFVRLGNSGH